MIFDLDDEWFFADKEVLAVEREQKADDKFEQYKAEIAKMANRGLDDALIQRQQQHNSDDLRINLARLSATVIGGNQA